jgi:hypothetical protein
MEVEVERDRAGDGAGDGNDVLDAHPCKRMSVSVSMEMEKEKRRCGCGYIRPPCATLALASPSFTLPRAHRLAPRLTSLAPSLPASPGDNRTAYLSPPLP